MQACPNVEPKYTCDPERQLVDMLVGYPEVYAGSPQQTYAIYTMI